MTFIPKRKLTAVAILAGAVTFISISSATEAHERGKRAKKNSRVVKMFNRLETNNDRVLTIEEFASPAAERTERRFARKDADEDGFLTFEEITSGRDVRDLSDIAEEIAQCVADIKEETGNDRIQVPDPNNYLSPEDRFSAADTSGDELIDPNESEAASLARAETTFSEMDSNPDQQVTLDEFILHRHVKKATRRAVGVCLAELNAEQFL